MISGSTGLARVRAENGDAYMHGIDRFDIHYLWLVESPDWDNRRQSGADFPVSQAFPGLGDSWSYLPKQVRQDLRLCLRFFRGGDGPYSERLGGGRSRELAQRGGSGSSGAALVLVTGHRYSRKMTLL